MTISTYPTQNTLDVKTREKVIPLLNDSLAKLLQLSLLTKQAHWNMRGPNFISVHEMLDPFNDKLLDFADEVAERIAQLGGVANGTPEAIIAQLDNNNYPQNISQVEDHLSALLTRYGFVAKHIKSVLQQDTDMHDDVGANILTDVVQELEKYIWFIEAHLNYTK